jgi:1-aminocyclopropane-1-carboxylate deaminase
LIVPYGGSNEAGRKGAEEIATLIPEEYTHVCCAVGSGTTLIGLRNALPEHQLVLGFAPLKKGTYLRDELQPFIATPYDSNWSLTDEFHFGGFGKWEYNQIHFMNLMYALHEVPLDVVYTSKMLFGVRDLIAQSYFPKNSNILCVHSGGLQGNISVANHLIF